MYFQKVPEAQVHVEGYVELPEGSQLGLPNVYQKWLAAPLFRKSEAIRSHFDTILLSLAQPKHINPDAFKVVVLAPEYPQDSDSVMLREIGGGIHLALVQDDPKYLQYHPFSKLHVLGLSEQQIWDLALHQTFRDEESSWQFARPRNSNLLIADSQSCFVATGIAFLDRITTYSKAVVAIPTRHVLMLLPFEAEADGNSISLMTRFAREAYNHGPGSLYPCLFLWERDKPLQAYRSS